jgi:hypothetical protein
MVGPQIEVCRFYQAFCAKGWLLMAADGWAVWDPMEDWELEGFFLQWVRENGVQCWSRSGSAPGSDADCGSVPGPAGCVASGGCDVLGEAF